jgi:outer membrane lipoprotein-sorting protein
MLSFEKYIKNFGGIMKKFASILAVLFVLSFITAGFAQEAAAPAEEVKAAAEVKEAAPVAETKATDSKIPETLMKAYEKMTADVAFSMEVKTKMNGQEFNSKTQAYFKDAKHYRMDSEVAGQKTRMVVDGEIAWTYMEAANMIMTMPVPPSPTDLKKDIEYTEGKDGENVTYTFTDANSQMKVVTAVNPKDLLVVKMNTFDAKGEQVSEMTYGGWKFEKIDDSIFKKPEGAQEMKMPAQPAPTE